MIEKDVVVVGSGGAGLSAAVVAACEGLDVLVVEKSDYFGGTTALSGGGIWIPMSAPAIDAGFHDSLDAARTYVRKVVGPTLDLDQLDRFLETAPKALDYLMSKTDVQFALEPGFPDYQPDIEGAVDDGRLLSPVPYDGKHLGEYFPLIRPPLSEFNAPGGFMIAIGDMPHLENMTRSLKSFLHMARLIGRFLIDRLRYPRGTRLTMGNAFVARLVRSALDNGVELWRSAPVIELVEEQSRVTGVVVERDGKRVEVRARRGVMLASGGFSANPEMRKRYIPYPEHHVSLVPESNTGDGINMGSRIGGTLDEGNVSNAMWTVMSLATDLDGNTTKYPHIFMDRPKPGCIAVNRDGRRFTNEANLNMVKDMHATDSVPAHLICDRKFIRKYGLGIVKPGGLGLKKWLKAGYIVSAPTVRELAEKIGCDPVNLEETVARMNQFAAEGVDHDFGKGSSTADRGIGDPRNKPNPSLGPIKTAPFYAVKILPGDSTTTLGLKVNPNAQVLNENGEVIEGLYAAGLDMNSLWRGVQPANGGNNAPSLTFGYIAAMDMASKPG